MAKAKGKNHLVPVIASLVVMFSIGIVYIWSVFQRPVMAHYGWEASAVTYFSAIMVLMFFFGTMVGGFIQDRTSPRFVIMLGAALFFVGLLATSLLPLSIPVWVMYVTYGGIAGTGVGLAYAGALNSIQRWYPHKRGLASGLSVCAFGLSVIAFTPVIEWLLKLPAFGDNAVPLTFRTLAFLFTILIVVSGLFVRNPDEDYIKSLNLPAKATDKKQYTPKEVLKSAPFWWFVATAFFIPTAYMIMLPLVKILGESRAIPETQLSLTVSLMGFASAGSRLICGPVSDKIGREKTLFIIAVLALFSSILIIFAEGWVYTVAVLLVTFSYAGPSSVYPAMSTDLYGLKHSGGNYGMVLMSMGISSPIFTFLSNTLRENSTGGDYTMSFIVASCLTVIPLVSIPMFAVTKKRLQARDQQVQKS